ncbi:MAG TPA: SDR family oxidoreductase [Steroidobacteraceae bacterium]|jgi:NAD(P)-dependent dehydrogenase (short-subunit alcohol dehydrogenase family)
MNNSKIALVTGAGSGIGRATALALLNAGFSVALAGRRREALEHTVSQSPKDSVTLAVPTDVRDEASVTALFQAIRHTFGRLDLLFNNAGIGAPQIPIDELSLAQWNDIVAVNLTGVFLCARAAFALMKEQRPQGGRIINNGSLSAQVPRPMSAPYTATKHAITGLTRSLSLDGRIHRIACGQIDIGNATTAMTLRMPHGALQADGSTREEPTVNVQHVADAVVQMAKLPLDANIQFMTIMATQMPFIGRG